jgi:hypothetical protein
MHCETRLRRRRPLGAGSCVALLAVGAIACGSTSKPAPRPAATAAPGAPQLRLLEQADLRKFPAGAPQRAVLTLWYWSQWGSWPNVVTAYAPAVRKAVGDDRIAGTYAQQRGTMQLSQIEIRGVDTGSTATVVRTIIRPPAGAPIAESWTLREGAAHGWEVLHDTFLERGLTPYVQAVTQDRVAPGASKIDPRAQLAARRAREAYQNLFLKGGAVVRP